MRYLITVFAYVLFGTQCNAHIFVANSNSNSQEVGNSQPVQRLAPSSFNGDCRFDFANFSYPPAFENGKSFQLINGESQPSRDSDGLVVGTGFSLASTIYAEVTGDNRNEAIVTVDIITGGSATPRVSYVFDMAEQSPRVLWKYVSGDRASGGLRNIYGNEHRLVIETYSNNNSVGTCCPKFFDVKTYKWESGHFNLVSTKSNLMNESGGTQFLGKKDLCHKVE